MHPPTPPADHRASRRPFVGGTVLAGGAAAAAAAEIETGVLISGRTKYIPIDYEDRDFSFPAPDIALMTGRVRMQAVTQEATLDNLLSFLAVCRLEEGRWRFLAWQSCRMPPPVPR